MALKVNDPNKVKPLGGTEMLYHSLSSKIDLSDVNLILSVCDYRLLSDTKPNLLWLHLSYDQENVQLLKDENFVSRLSGIVFVSHWQYEKFWSMFPIHLTKTYVIENWIEPVEYKEKPEKIKLIYTSTPWRGLEILIEVLKRMDRKDIDVEVYSGTTIYGQDFYDQTHAQFVPLYEELKRLGVKHTEYAPNEDVKKALQTAHIMSYPNIFEETSCLSVIEALSAGCRVVSTSLGALPETTRGYANLLTLGNDYIEKYTEALEKEIDNFWAEETQSQLQDQREYCSRYWSWETREDKWRFVLNDIKPLSAPDFLIKKSKENWMPAEHIQYLKTLEKPKVVYDIGSSILHWRKSAIDAWGEFEYYAFDATPELEKLYQSKNINYSINVLSDKEKEVDFYNDPFNPTGNSYYKELTNYYADVKPTKVMTKTIDSIVKENNLPLPDFIKIDVQGAELDILKGASETIKQCKDIILESQHSYYNAGAPKSQELFPFVESLGFEKVAQIYKGDYDGDYHFSRL